MQSLILHSPILAIAIPLLAAFLTPLVGKFSSKARNVLVITALSFTAFLVFILARDIYATGLHVYTLGALSPTLATPENFMIPVRIVLEVDAMSALMGIIAVTVTLAVAIYSTSSVKRETGGTKFYTLLLLLTVGMVGLVYTGDLFNMFIFLEILSISGAALAGFRIRSAVAIEGAFKYLVISAIGALVVLFAVGIFYGQYNLLNIAALANVMQYTRLDQLALVLLIMAFGMKLASVPMHMWAPDTYTVAPSGTSAMLVVASQASMYALFRVCFSLYGVTMDTATVGWIIIILGVLSMFVGVTVAVKQTDIKRLMAYHAISQSGYMLLGVGVGIAVLADPVALASYGRAAMSGGIFHIINHAFYKGLLFLSADALLYRLGTRDFGKMGGMARNMKYTCIFFIIGALAISGIPPLNGFTSKLMIYESVYQFSPVLAIIAILVSILTLASFTKAFQSAFTGPALPQYGHVTEVPRPMLVGMGILAALIIFFSLFPSLIVNTIITPATDALINQAGYITAVMGGP